jgi:CRISPR system Cascade subunit CasE
MITAIRPLYLSKLVLDIRSSRSIHFIDAPSTLYGVLLAALGETKEGHHGSYDGDNRALLYRVEPPSSHVSSYTILVQTSIEPDWSLSEAKGAFIRSSHIKEYRQYRDDSTPIYEIGQLLSFRLYGNATRAFAQPNLSDGTFVRGRVKPIYDVDEQRKWLVRKLQDVVIIKDVSVITAGEIYMDERSGRRPKKRMLSVHYDGIMAVQDPQKLANIIANGIGRGKAYGLGLLSVARA